MVMALLLLSAAFIIQSDQTTRIAIRPAMRVFFGAAGCPTNTRMGADVAFFRGRDR